MRLCAPLIRAYAKKVRIIPGEYLVQVVKALFLKYASYRLLEGVGFLQKPPDSFRAESGRQDRQHGNHPSLGLLTQQILIHVNKHLLYIHMPKLRVLQGFQKQRGAVALAKDQLGLGPGGGRGLYGL